MTKSLKQFIQENKIRMDVKHAYNNPNMAADDKWMASAQHYKCILRCGKRQMTVPFSQGVAINHEPTAEDVLDCLASDANGVRSCGTFEDWCGEYGYDTDSRKAEKTFKICDLQADKLERLLGQIAFNELLTDVERL